MTTKREFLNNIEVSPGSVIAPNSTQPTVTVQKSESKQKSNVIKTKSNEKIMSVNIETANLLQIKYAILMDVTVEKLENLPLLTIIDKWWGTKYCLGGSTDNCIDCSAFTQVILREVYQQQLPRTAQEQFTFCEKVELEELREGDLVFFSTSEKEVSHVGVYLTNNKFTHASTSGGVMISDLNEPYWHGKYKGAGRVEK